MNESAKARAATPAGTDIDEARKGVLIVDDDEKLRANLQIFFTDNGFRPSCVSNVNEALEAAASGDVHVALIDYRLGAESGIDLIQEFRRQEPDLPIVLMSGYLDDSIERLGNRR